MEKAAHLVIADGLECFLPLDALVDAAKVEDCLRDISKIFKLPSPSMFASISVGT